MIVFAGEQTKGYWLDEVVSGIDQECMYVSKQYHIQEQVNEILAAGSCQYVIFDIEQYIDDADVIADYVNKICSANNAEPIILASGYLPTSEAVVTLIEQGISYFILATEVSEIKDQFLKCVNGYYKANGIEAVEDIRENIEKRNFMPANIKLIGVGGIKPGIGTTTQCMQIVQYINFCGWRACYIELNKNQYVQDLISTYEEVEEVDPVIGKVKYNGIDMFYNQEKISEVLQTGYDFYVYDYGVFNDTDFNKTSFLEKNIKIFVVGCKPNEMKYTYNVIRSLFYQDVRYIFNFTSENDRENLLSLMEEKADQTFFAEFSPDPFTYRNADFYHKMIPLEIKTVPESPKKKGLFSWKKR